MKKLLSSWLPPLVWAGLIFFLSSRSAIETSAIYWQDFILKKTAHMVEYGIFAILLYRALRMAGVEKKKAGILAIAGAIVYGSTDEFHQSFIPGREPRVRDVVFDTIGAGLAIYAIWKLLPKAHPKLKNLAVSLRLL